ncbi:MAG: hypothetical protein ACR2HR_05825 [Euzebya sp.]
MAVAEQDLNLIDGGAYDRIVLAGLESAISGPTGRQLSEAADRGTPPTP